MSAAWRRTATEDDGPPEPAGAGQAGHLLLTSGTSGAPAVVSVPAGALPALLRGYAAELGLTAADVFGWTVPPAHDPVFRDLFLPLLLGAPVRVPAPADLGPRRLAGWLAESGVTVLHLTPSQAGLLAAADRTLPALRAVVCHGETLRGGTVAALARLAPDAEIWNCYGTTETPQAASLYRVVPGAAGAASAGPAGAVPIGAGAPLRSVRVEGPGGERGTGILGELVVSGAGLACPAGAARPGAEYRTGDLGRLRPDGLIDIAGRADRQVSVGGYRVQLDGIEAVLLELPGVRAAHATADPATGRPLAWWAGTPGPTEDGALAALRDRLPEQAIPARVHRVDTLPVTARGKVDTAALLRQAPAREAVAPQPARLDGLLRMLLDGAAAVAPGTRLGPDTDFFDAGLTSLALLRLHEAVRAQAGPALEIADLFRHPTPRRLAEYLAQRQSGLAAAPGQALPPRPPGGRDGGLGAELDTRRALRRAAAAHEPSRRI